MPLTLLYHAVFDLEPQADPGLHTLVVAPHDLERQLGHLAARGIPSLTLDELHAGKEGVLLTFDDAYAHVFGAVTPLLERHGFTGVMFVPAGHIGGANDWDGPPLPVAGLPIAGVAELAEAAAGPWELASHGMRHVDLRALPHEAAVLELTAAREQVSELAGGEVLELAYPYGRFDEGTKLAAREAGYRAAFAADSAPAGGGPFALPRRVIRGQENHTAFRVKTDEELGRPFG